MAALSGVAGARLNFGAAKLTVEGNFNPEAVILEGRKHDIYARPEGETLPEDAEQQDFWRKNRMVVISGLSGLAALCGWLVKITGGPEKAVISLFLAAVFIGGASTARKAAFSLRKLSFDMNVLMTIAVTGAMLIGEWSEGAAVAFLFSVSNTLESYTMDKARRSIRDLMDIAPKEACVRRDGNETFLPVSGIRLGDILLVKPGEKIAMDGRIIRGSTSVNQAAVTGESIPVEKGTGSEVFAGTLNQEGAIEVEVTKLVNDTAIARIIHMVEEAQAQKAPSQKFVDRFAAIYTPIVLALAAGVALVPPLFFNGAWPPWIYRGLVMLVVSCPCALVVSTPVALVSAIGNAAKHGVLIKGGIHLEQAGSLTVVAFDKTGTLTIGRPVVTDIIPVREHNKNRLLSLAAGIEQLSEHPLARAVVHKALEEGLEPVNASLFTAIAGKGARAEINGQAHFIGSPVLFAGMPAWTSDIAAIAEQLQEQGKTAMVLGTDKEILGVLAVADEVRPSSGMAVRGLKQAGVRRTVMLTGDNEPTARAIARKTGIDEFYGELLPENKVEVVRNLLAKYGKAAMVGDGINDAPALAAATVGIAMGAAGTDAALETADIALMGDDLTKLSFIMRLSRAALRTIKQNIAFSIAIKALAILLIFPGWLTLWLAIFADMGASVLVTLNGIRLIGVKP